MMKTGDPINDILNRLDSLEDRFIDFVMSASANNCAHCPLHGFCPYAFNSEDKDSCREFLRKNLF